MQQSKALEDLFLNVDLFSFVTFVWACFASTDCGSSLPLQPAVCEDLQVQHAELQKALQVGSHWFDRFQAARLRIAVPLVFYFKELLGQSSLRSEARNESGVLKAFTTAYFCWLTGFPGERPAVPRVS